MSGPTPPRRLSGRKSLRNEKRTKTNRNSKSNRKVSSELGNSECTEGDRDGPAVRPRAVRKSDAFVPRFHLRACHPPDPPPQIPPKEENRRYRGKEPERPRCEERPPKTVFNVLGWSRASKSQTPKRMTVLVTPATEGSRLGSKRRKKEGTEAATPKRRTPNPPPAERNLHFDCAVFGFSCRGRPNDSHTC